MERLRITHLAKIVFNGVILLTSFNAYADLPPRLALDAYASDYTVGQADMMLPLASDRNHNFYINPALSYGSDNQGYADVGVGYRWIHNEAAILGGYLFGGYSRIANNARIWIANPGIEAFGSRWDAHLNGYVVMGDRHQMLQTGVQSSPSYFSGHSQLVNLFNFTQYQYAGNGADVSVDYQIFPESSLKGFLGGYYFAPSNGNIGGGVAGLEYWLDSYLKVFAAYSYDNIQHSTGALGLGVEFGGTHYHRVNPDLEERITDPVQRYLAELGHGSKIPTRTVTNNSGVASVAVLNNNIAFFSQAGTPNDGGAALTLANCTFENPCGNTDFSQPGVDTLNSLLPNTIMYFNGGNYPALNVAGTGPITLNTGQSVNSRTSDYSAPAAGSSFSGGFILNGNNTLSNITILPVVGATVGGTAIQATGANNILITGTQVVSNGISNSFRTGVNLTNVNNGTIQSSEINSANGFAYPGSFIINNSSNITIQDSTINILTTNGSIGVDVFSSSVNIQNTNITSMNTTSGANRTDAFTTAGNSIITIENSTLTAIGITNNGSDAIFINGPGSTVTSNNNQLNATNTGAGAAVIVRNIAGSTANVNLSTLNVTGGTASITSGPGIQINNSTCIVNGSAVACS